MMYALATLALFQDSVPALPDVPIDALGSGDWTGLLAALVAVLVAWATQHVLEGIKRVASFVDAFPAILKQVSAVVIAFGLMWLGEFLQTPLPETLQAFDATSVQALLSGIGAWAIHAGKRARSDGL